MDVKLCCCITLNPETQKSQNGFCFYELFLHKKNSIINMTKISKLCINFIFNPRLVVNQIILYDIFVEFSKHPFVMQPLQIPPLPPVKDEKNCF